MKRRQNSILTRASILAGSIAILITAPLTSRAAVAFLGVASGDASSEDATVWTRAKDDASSQAVAVNVQVSTDATFKKKVSAFSAGTADAPTDYTVKANLVGLLPGTTYYYRFLTANGAVVSNVGKFKTAPKPNKNVAVRFAFSGDCDGLIRPYALASQVPAKNLDFFMFDGDAEYVGFGQHRVPRGHQYRESS